MNLRGLKQDKIIEENNTDNSSFFKFYKDGIGFNNYSVRLSNFSFNNIPKNLALLTSFAINVGVASANRGVAAGDIVINKCITVVNQLNNMNHLFHYCVETNDDPHNVLFFKKHISIDSKLFLDAILNNTCNATYVPERQNEYRDLTFKTIYARPECDKFLKFFCDNYIPDISLLRDTSQPNIFFAETENCLKKLIDEVYAISVRDNDAEKEKILNAGKQLLEECAESLQEASPYLLPAIGLFSVGYYAYNKYKNSAKNQSNNSSDHSNKVKELTHKQSEHRHSRKRKRH